MVIINSHLLYAQPDIDWQRTIGGSNYEELQAMSYALDNQGYIFSGQTSSPISGDVAVNSAESGDSDCWVVNTNIDATVINWQKRYGCSGFERMWDILPLTDGSGYLLLGESSSNACTDDFGHIHKREDSRGGKDIWLIKINPQGEMLWDRTYGGTGDDVGRKIFKTNDGNYLIGGFSNSQDSLTTGIGERTAPLRCNAIQNFNDCDYDGNIDQSDCDCNYDYWVVKINPDGEKIADYAYGGTPDAQWNGDDILHDMYKTPEGNFILGGHSTSNAGFEKSEDAYGYNDFWVIHIDENGNKIPTSDNKPGDYTFGGNRIDVLQEILITRDGGFLFVGESSSDTNTGNKTSEFFGEITPFSFNEDYWIVKLDSSFNMQWQKTYGGSGFDFPHVIWENQSGKLWIAGDSNSPPSGNKTDNTKTPNKNDIWMLLLTPEGEKIWEQSYGGAEYEAPEEILQAIDGGYVLGAHSNSNQGFDKTEDSKGMNDFWIIKTNCSIANNELDIETNVCNGQPFPLSADLENCEGCTYEWADGTNDTIRIVSLSENTDFEILVTDADGCEREAVLQTIVQSNPQLLELEIMEPSCTDEEDGSIEVLEAEGGILPYQYSLNDNYFGSIGNYEDLEHGEYKVTLRDSIGCISDTIVALRNPLLPLIDIGADTLIELGDSILVHVNQSIGVDTFIWSNPEMVSCPNCPFTYITPTGSFTYEIYAYNEQGCETRDTKHISVKRDFPYYTPTAFTPNNDGENDIFTIYTSNSIKEVRNFSIYNRWGNLLFNSKSLTTNDPAYGWDGIHRGQLVPTGTYVWEAEIEYIDGRTQVIKGDVTLFR